MRTMWMVNLVQIAFGALLFHELTALEIQGHSNSHTFNDYGVTRRTAAICIRVDASGMARV